MKNIFFMTGSGNVAQPKFFITAAIIVLLVAAGTVMLLIQNKNGDDSNSSNPASAILDPDAEDWTGARTTRNTEPTEDIRIPGYKSITVEANTRNVSVNLHNPEKNNCYFVIRLVLADTGETLYESKMIAPGKGLYNITLSRPLEAGTYKAKLQYEPYDMATLARLNGAVIDLDLIAK
ncbi:MAG TPA: tRNA (uracil-5-)-methyltransferase [Clostridiales bacterium]|nr:tRNA (uracil-5-)-methyltransferase [Clostridiales bacterium]